MNLCFLETTSLYGNIKSSSQYDGLEPYIKYNGMTESDLFLFPSDNIYMKLRNFLRPIYGQSWNSWDSFIINFMNCNKKSIIIIILIIILTIIIIYRINW